MKTTKEQRAELRDRTPTRPQAMYQLYVRCDELHDVLDDLDEAEASAERYREALRNIASSCDGGCGVPCDGCTARAALDAISATSSPDDYDPGTALNAMRANRPVSNLNAPDDAERAARLSPAPEDEYMREAQEWCDARHGDVNDASDHASLARLLRTRDAQARADERSKTPCPHPLEKIDANYICTRCGIEQPALRERDAQAREAGRVEGWREAVAECARLVSAHAIAVPQSYAVTIDTLGDVERDIRALKRPDRAK